MSHPNVAVLETDHSNDIVTFTKVGETMRNGIEPRNSCQVVPVNRFNQ